MQEYVHGQIVSGTVYHPGFGPQGKGTGMELLVSIQLIKSDIKRGGEVSGVTKSQGFMKIVLDENSMMDFLRYLPNREIYGKGGQPKPEPFIEKYLKGKRILMLIG